MGNFYFLKLIASPQARWFVAAAALSMGLFSIGEPVDATAGTKGDISSTSAVVELGRQVGPGIREVSLVFSEPLAADRTSGTEIRSTLEKIDSIAAKPVSITGTQDWFSLLYDDFESGFSLATWTLDNVAGTPYWGDWTCWSGTSATHSAGCAVSGTGAIGCGGLYPNDMDSWMTAGPFSLAEPTITAGVLQCDLNLNVEPDVDYFYLAVSANGVDWYGYQYTGTFSQSVSLDLAAVPTYGDMLGQSAIYVSLGFYSDFSIGYANGAMVDDVLLVVEMPVANQAPFVTVTNPNGGDSISAGATQAITYTATDPDSGPGAMTVSFDYSTNSGGTWTTIATGQANTESYNWTVPDIASTTARVRVRVNDGADESYDISDADFSIVQNQNLVDLGDASGPSGTSVTVQLSLDNDDLVKGIQADILFDGTQAFFTGITAAGRASGMAADGEQIDANRARIILYYDDSSQLAAGSGDVAEVTFTLQGPGGGSTALTLSDLVLSGPTGNSLTVTGTTGLLTVETPQAIPVLQVPVLKNPGRPRTMQILVKISNGSGSVPTVTAGGSNVTMTSIGQAVYVGDYSATQTTDSVTITATDNNIVGLGTGQVTVSFQ